MPLQKVTIDFETYWDNEFTLTNYSFIEYINDPRFETISVSIKIDNEPTQVYAGPNVAEALRAIDWGNSIAIAHNGNEFDFPILVWKFDCHPKLFVDTLCLARPKHQMTAGGSLRALSEYYGLPPKDNTALLDTKGKRYADLDLRELARLLKYNTGDSDNCYELFKRFAPSTPVFEWQMMDMTARMACYPKFESNQGLLADTLAEVKEMKTAQLEEVADIMGCLSAEEVLPQLHSSVKFAAVLRALGVEPPTKISKKTGKTTYAFAKDDDGLKALLEHDDERVQMVAAARLGAKSTLLETRLRKMLHCAARMGGKMPIPLAYHAATTGRWGGRVWNPQNLPRIPRDKAGNIIKKATNALRMSLRAPNGHKVIVSDSSGIELRVNHYLWNVRSTQDLYDSDPEADLYKEFAMVLFGVARDEVTKDMRQVAKVAQLGLGFGAGAKTFQRVAKTMGGVTLDDVEAARVVNAWRTMYKDIAGGWRLCSKGVQFMHMGSEATIDPRGLVKTRRGALTLPSGRSLYYPSLRLERDEDGNDNYVYGDGSKKSKVYGGLLDENIVQAIARDVIAWQALQIKAETGLDPAHTVHDELVYVVPDDKAEWAMGVITKWMRTAPPWLPGIVLWSEGDIAGSYGEAK